MFLIIAMYTADELDSKNTFLLIVNTTKSCDTNASCRLTCFLVIFERLNNNEHFSLSELWFFKP